MKLLLNWGKEIRAVLTRMQEVGGLDQRCNHLLEKHNGRVLSYDIDHL